MKALLGSLFLCLGLCLMLAVPDGRVSAQAPSDPMIGTWILNIQKSKFPDQPPKSIRRTFDYTRDGLILCTHETVDAQGKHSFNHWYLGLDGKDYPEFARGESRLPVFFLSFKVIDPYTKENISKRATPDGKVSSSYRKTLWTVSKDGKTLTQDITPIDAQGKPTSGGGATVRVYDREAR